MYIVPCNITLITTLFTNIWTLKFKSRLHHRQPKLCGSSMDFEFIRECMKINKIRPKFQFWTNIEIKMTYLVLPCGPGVRVMFWRALSRSNGSFFGLWIYKRMYENKQNASKIPFFDKTNDLACVFVLFFTVSSPLVPVIWKPFYSTFKILSCTNSKKNGKAGDSKADRSSSKLHKSHKNGPNSPKFPSKDVSIICLSLLCLWSFRFHHNCQRSRKLLILNFFYQSFLSRDAYDRALNGRSKLTSQ